MNTNMSFFKTLSFKGYVLAGNSVANMIEEIPLQGDWDFWAEMKNDFLSAFVEFSRVYKRYEIYPSMIKMHHDTLPEINLMYTDMSPDETVSKFDWDYCRCYYTPETGIVSSDSTTKSIKEKVIYNPRKIITFRVLKALKYGYSFTENFWKANKKFLLKNHPANSSYEPWKISLDDLDMSKFKQEIVVFTLSDVNNIEKTLEELANQYKQLLEIPYAKMPYLISTDDVELVKKYIHAIIFKNPTRTVDYMDITLGSYIIELYNVATDSTMMNNFDYENEKIISKPSEQVKEVNHEKISKEIYEEVKEVNHEKTFSPPKEKYIKTVIPNKIPRILSLNEDGTSYIQIDYLPEIPDNFKDMWELHPSEKHKIIMYEQETEVYRYSKSYGNTPNDLFHTKKSSYMYSGYDTSQNNEELPDAFSSIYTYMKSTDPRYNQTIVNWYEKEDDFIAFHADCQRCMIPNAKISIVSLYENISENNYRYLVLKNKRDGSNIRIRLDHGTIVSMCGKTQDEFLHAVPKMNHSVCPRISISFRQMI